jgi:hypothetical protein
MTASICILFTTDFICRKSTTNTWGEVKIYEQGLLKGSVVLVAPDILPQNPKSHERCRHDDSDYAMITLDDHFPYLHQRPREETKP